jgi:hypothetical protein
VVVALEPVSKMAADITDSRALGGNLRLIRSPRQRLLARANVVDRMSGSMRGNSAASERSMPIWKASKTRRGEPAGPEYGLVPSFLPNIRELTRVEIPGGAYSDNHRSA